MKSIHSNGNIDETEQNSFSTITVVIALFLQFTGAGRSFVQFCRLFLVASIHSLFSIAVDWFHSMWSGSVRVAVHLNFWLHSTISCHLYEIIQFRNERIKTLFEPSFSIPRKGRTSSTFPHFFRSITKLIPMNSLVWWIFSILLFVRVATTN